MVAQVKMCVIKVPRKVVVHFTEQSHTGTGQPNEELLKSAETMPSPYKGENGTNECPVVLLSLK